MVQLLHFPANIIIFVFRKQTFVTMSKLRIFLLGLAVAAGCMAAKAQSIQALENDQYSIGLSHITMVVDAGHGGKILSFRYDEKEMLSQTRWPNSFGSTFWTSPQAEWNWPPVPEYDTKPYTVEQTSPTLVISSQPTGQHPYRIRKEFRADEEDNAIAVTYFLINETQEERKVAPWEITRVPNGGTVIRDAQAEDITPADLMPFEFRDGVAWYAVDVTEANRKINADGKGWLAFHDNGLLMVKMFQDLSKDEPAPGEAEVQVYVNARKTFVELESQGPYTLLKPGESLAWTVRWYLEPMETPDSWKKAVLK